jgi:hypothetical protein
MNKRKTNIENILFIHGLMQTFPWKAQDIF